LRTKDTNAKSVKASETISQLSLTKIAFVILFNTAELQLGLKDVENLMRMVAVVTFF